jgi:hypothetical protein
MVLVNKIATSACRNHRRPLHGITPLLNFLFTYYFIFVPLFIVFVAIYPHNLMLTTTFICSPDILLLSLNRNMRYWYTCIIVLKSPPINVEVEHLRQNHIHIWKMIRSNHPSGKPYIWCICKYTVCTVPD